MLEVEDQTRAHPLINVGEKKDEEQQQSWQSTSSIAHSTSLLLKRGRDETAVDAGPVKHR